MRKKAPNMEKFWEDFPGGSKRLLLHLPLRAPMGVGRLNQLATLAKCVSELLNQSKNHTYYVSHISRFQTRFAIVPMTIIRRFHVFIQHAYGNRNSDN